MTENRITSIGVLASDKNNISFILINSLLLKLGYEIMLDNKTMTIYANKKNFIILFQITPDLVESMLRLNIDFDILIHTSLDYEEYKNELINKLVRNSKYFIMNVDEKQSFRLLKDNASSIVVSYGLSKKATVTVSSLTLSEKIQFNICIQREIFDLNNNKIEPMEYPIYTELIGSSKLYNIVSSLICLLICGIKLEKIKNAILNIKGIYRRLDKIWDKDYTVLDNYCSNITDYIAAFEEVQNLKYNDMYLIISRDSGIDKEFHIVLETILDWKLALNIKKVFIYNGIKDKSKEDEIRNIFKYEDVKYDLYDDLNICLLEGVNSLNKGDLMLLLGGELLDNARTLLPVN